MQIQQDFELATIRIKHVQTKQDSLVSELRIKQED